MSDPLKVTTTSPVGKGKAPPGIALQRRKAAAERARGMLAQLAPGRSLSNDLIAERRKEARAEEQADRHSTPTKRRGDER